MLEIEKNNLSNNLENKKHYVINNKHNNIIFNDRIIKRYTSYYSASTSITHNLPHNYK